MAIRKFPSRHYLDESFPLQIAPMYPQNDVCLHGHSFTELVIITRGQGVHFSDNGEYPITAGDVFVIHGEEAHGYRSTHGLCLVNILYDLERLKLPLADLLGLAGYHALFSLEPKYRRKRKFGLHLRLEVKDLAMAESLIEKIQAELGTRAGGYQCLIGAFFMQLLCFLSRRYESLLSPPSRECLRLGSVFSHLEQNYRDEIRVGELCRMAHLSESGLLRAFKILTGHSPSQYVLRLRVREACSLLRGTDLSITEVAYRSGFRDSNYFSRAFHQVAGATPSVYREAQRFFR